MYLGPGPGFALSVPRRLGRPVAAATGLSGGLEPASADCPQPVHTNDRDALRTEIGNWTSPHTTKHIAEGHPDIFAAWEDIRGRLRGLYDLPKRLRCEKEARDRAERWLDQLFYLCNNVKQIGYPGCKGYTTVPKAFSFTVFRGPTYTIRSSQDPAVNAAMQAFAGNPTTEGAKSLAESGPPPEASAPQGSVVIDGQVYESSQAAAQAVSTATQTAVSNGATGVTSGEIFSSSGSVGGIPTSYLLYGGLALAAVMLLKK